MDGSDEPQRPAKKFKGSDEPDPAKNQASVNSDAPMNNTNQLSSGVSGTETKPRRTHLPVMRCIGILPSLPIVSKFRDSEDSDSSLEDVVLTVLPTVPRPRRDEVGCD